VSCEARDELPRLADAVMDGRVELWASMTVLDREHNTTAGQTLLRRRIGKEWYRINRLPSTWIEAGSVAIPRSSADSGWC